jgi:hypothetical protein
MAHDAQIDVTNLNLQCERRDVLEKRENHHAATRHLRTSQGEDKKMVAEET